MREKEQRLFARIESHRREIIAEADQLTAEQLTFRPTPNAWSALDVVEHLVKVEEAIAERARPREPRGPVETVRAKAALGLMRVLFLARGRIRVPVQGVLPLCGVTLSDLARRWEAAQVALRERLETFEPGDWSRPMMRHPLIGRLTPAESLNFLHWHMGHHQRQIARIRRAQGYPRS
jgi:DinB superfamily